MHRDWPGRLLTLGGAPPQGPRRLDRGNQRPGEPEPAGLELRAAAGDPEALARLQDVLARHLEHFGARRELIVTWGPATGDVDSFGIADPAR